MLEIQIRFERECTVNDEIKNGKNIFMGHFILNKKLIITSFYCLFWSGFII